MVSTLLMFPGQGSQYVGMAKEWFTNFKEAELAFEEASDGSGLKLKRLCFDSTDYDLKQTEITQPAILTATVAIFRSLEAMGVVDKSKFIYAGHSLGEYSALTCMGVLSLGECAKIVNHRGQYMQEAVPADVGAMVALIFKPGSDGVALAQALCDEAQSATGKAISVANFNSAEQIVLAGFSESIEAATKIAAAKSTYQIRRAVPLAVSAPFHCELMQDAATRLEPELHALKLNSSELRYIANVDAELHTQAQVAERLVAQITQSVRWVQSMQKALDLGCERAIEIGPGAVLTGLAKRISKDGKTLNASNIDRWETFKNAGSKL